MVLGPVLAVLFGGRRRRWQALVLREELGRLDRLERETDREAARARAIHDHEDARELRIATAVSSARARQQAESPRGRAR